MLICRAWLATNVRAYAPISDRFGRPFVGQSSHSKRNPSYFIISFFHYPLCVHVFAHFGFCWSAAVLRYAYVRELLNKQNKQSFCWVERERERKNTTLLAVAAEIASQIKRVVSENSQKRDDISQCRNKWNKKTAASDANVASEPKKCDTRVPDSIE